MINPITAAGQVEGGFSQALGFTLCEDMLFHKKGHLLNPRFGDYPLCKANEMPAMDVIFVQTDEPTGPFGAKSVAEICMDGVAPAMVQLVSLNTIEYLHKGGRIGHAQRLVGSLLDVKPLVAIDHSRGEVKAVANIRTRKRALKKLYEVFFQRLPDQGEQHIAVLHGDAEDEASAVYQRIQMEKQPAELLLTTTSPVLGVHTGPGAIAICGYCEQM